MGSERLESQEQDRARFRDPTRRAIARVCRDEALGSYAIGRELGRRPNTIAETLKAMVKDNTLVTGAGDGRVNLLYQLADGLGQALDEALLAANEPGQLTRGQLLLLIQATDVAELVRSLMPADVSGALLWSARLGPGTLLLAFESDAGDFVLDKLGARLAGTDVEVQQFLVRDVAGGPTLLEQGRALRKLMPR